jgi:hypothetical protein
LSHRDHQDTIMSNYKSQDDIIRGIYDVIAAWREAYPRICDDFCEPLKVISRDEFCRIS